MACMWPSMAAYGCTASTEGLINTGRRRPSGDHLDEVVILYSGSSLSYKCDEKENFGRTYLHKLGISW
ncbi:hypothetical protein ZWY2020_053198 [Hordeum vulgare]|nr:hypothetical protein ZWY2020_053198 [Hordeum vulgare]